MFRVRVPNDIVYNVTSDQSVIYYVNVNHIFFILMRRCYFCNWWIYKKYTTASDKTNIHTFDCKMGWFMRSMHVHFKNSKIKEIKKSSETRNYPKEFWFKCMYNGNPKKRKIKCLHRKWTHNEIMNATHFRGIKWNTSPRRKIFYALQCTAPYCTVLHIAVGTYRSHIEQRSHNSGTYVFWRKNRKQRLMNYTNDV